MSVLLFHLARLFTVAFVVAIPATAVAVMFSAWLPAGLAAGVGLLSRGVSNGFLRASDWGVVDVNPAGEGA